MQGRFKKSVMQWWFKKESKVKTNTPENTDSKRLAENKRECRRKKRLELKAR